MDDQWGSIPKGPGMTQAASLIGKEWRGKRVSIAGLAGVLVSVDIDADGAVVIVSLSSPEEGGLSVLYCAPETDVVILAE